jgi:hypothetical protein
MKRFWLWLLASAVAASAQAPAPPPESLILRVLAVQGTTQGLQSAQFEPGAEAAAPLVLHLPYDHYALVLQEERETVIGDTASFTLPEGHVLEVVLAEKSAEGLVHTEARVQRTTPDGVTVRALDTTALLPPNSMLSLEGLKVGGGELVVLIQLAKKEGQQDQESQQENQEQQEEKQDQKQQPQQQQHPEDQKKDEEQQPEPQPDEEGQDRQNIEAMLQSLEEMDEREVQDAVKDRTEIGMRGGNWW